MEPVKVTRAGKTLQKEPLKPPFRGFLRKNYTAVSFCASTSSLILTVLTFLPVSARERSVRNSGIVGARFPLLMFARRVVPMPRA